MFILKISNLKNIKIYKLFIFQKGSKFENVYIWKYA
jgi:hypothetical protein